MLYIADMKEKKKLTSIYLDPETLGKLKEQAEKEQRSMAGLIRRLISNYIQGVKAKEERIKNVFKKK